MGIIVWWIGISLAIKYFNDRRIRWYKKPKQKPYTGMKLTKLR
jgi:hypothetical protein